MLPVIVADQLLVQRKIHLVGSNGGFVVLGRLDFVCDLFQWGKILRSGLVHQHIAVRQIEDFSLHAALQQAVDDLESRIGLAGTGCHHKQKPLLPAGNGIHSPVHGNTLIIAGRIGGLAAVVGLVDDCFLPRRQVSFLLVPGSQLRFTGKFIQPELTLFPSQKVMLRKPVAVGAKCKGKVQHLRIEHGLLQTIGHAMVVVLRFENGNGIVFIEIEKIVRTLGLLTEHKIPFQVDSAVRNLRLHGDLSHIPLGGDRGRDILEFDIFFRHLLFIQNGAQVIPLHFAANSTIISNYTLFRRFFQFCSCVSF